jgi:hypothetical protein
MAGDHAYVADDTHGLQVVDISDPAAPTIVGDVTTPGPAYAVTLAGGYAYVADYYEGLQVIDVGEPTAPQIVGTAATPSYAMGVAVAGDLAYVAHGGGLTIVDVAAPTAPAVLGDLHTMYSAADVALAGSHAYVACGNLLHVVDVSAPAAPVLLGDVPVYSALGVAVAGNGIYLASDSAGLEVAPHQCGDGTPVFLSLFELEPRADAVTIRWRVVAGGEPATFRLTGRSAGSVWSVPHAETAPGRYLAEDRPDHLAPGAEIAYELAHRAPDGAWIVLDGGTVTLGGGAPARAARLTGIHPNPFNPRVTVSFRAERPGRLVVAVFDVAGRRVATLADRDFPAGPQTLVWEGRDAAGRAVPSGTYLVRLDGADAREVRKVQLVR